NSSVRPFLSHLIFETTSANCNVGVARERKGTDMKTKIASIIITTAAYLVLVGATPAGACPGNFLVTNTADTGAGSLRQAIADANADPCPSTITFDTAGVFATPQTITLTNGELVVSNNVIILGPGANVLAVNGNAASRVFHVSSNIVVTIAGLTITNGNASGSNGGGIINDHSTLTV